MGRIRSGVKPCRMASVFISTHTPIDGTIGALRRGILVVIVAAQRRT